MALILTAGWGRVTRIGDCRVWLERGGGAADAVLLALDGETLTRVPLRDQESAQVGGATVTLVGVGGHSYQRLAIEAPRSVSIQREDRRAGPLAQTGYHDPEAS